MKTKLLLTLLSIGIFNTYAQQETVDYVSNLAEPSGIVNQGNMLYVQGVKYVYQINTTATSPAPTVIYTAPADFHMTNLTISGNILYISEENYSESTDTFLGCRIISLDLTNLSAPANLVYTTTQYVSSLTANGTMIYFSSETDPDGDDNFTVQVHRIDVSVPNPVATVLVSNLTTDNEARDMAFYNNNLLISVGGQGKVFGFDVTDSPIVVSEYFSNLNFNKGMYVSGGSIFITTAHLVGTKELNTANPLNYIAQNTTYQDSNNGMTFNANFRDVLRIGDKLYMTLLNQGKVVMIQNANLATDGFSNDSQRVAIYNSKEVLSVKGLENSHTATVFDISGQAVVSAELSSIGNSIDISSLSVGVYILKLDNQKVFKFVK